MPTMPEFSMATFWSIMGFLAVLKSFIPPEVYTYLDQLMRRFFTMSLYHTVDVAGSGDAFGYTDALYRRVEVYLGSILRRAEHLRAWAPDDSSGVRFQLAPARQLKDMYEGRAMLWMLHEVQPENGGSRPKKTVALEPATKQDLICDLLAFKEGREFYSKMGRAWKRGYLLHGPAGTGKSSLVAAIANFMDYDIYDLELTKVSSNTELRQLLTRVCDRAVVVVEDIDCSLQLESRTDQGKKKKRKQEPWLEQPQECSDEELDEPREEQQGDTFWHSDGLWSSCSREKIFIFTTN